MLVCEAAGRWDLALDGSSGWVEPCACSRVERIGDGARLEQEKCGLPGKYSTSDEQMNKHPTYAEVLQSIFLNTESRVYHDC